MKKSEVKKRIREGFSELSPDLFESIQNAAKQECLILQETECKTALNQNRSYTKGEKYFHISKYALSFCTCLAVLFLCLLGIHTSDKQYGYLTVDINPSIKIVFNDSCQIKQITGLNQDGKNIIEQLEQKREDTVFDILDDILQKAASESYLKKDGGILVTLCVSGKKQYNDMEEKLGQNMDAVIKELGLSNITTVFWQNEQAGLKSGRELLETKLVEEYDIGEEEARKMSMMELISYCRENTSYSFQYSPQSEKQWKTSVKQKDSMTEEPEKTQQNQTDKASENVRQEPEPVPKNTEEEIPKENLPVQNNIAPQNEQPPAVEQPNIVPEIPEESVPEPVQPEQSPVGNEQLTEETAPEPKVEEEKDV